MIRELANWALLTSLLVIAILAFNSVWHMRLKKMREYRRQKYSASSLGDKSDLSSVLPSLSKDEMRRIAIGEKSNKEQETINLDNYHGLPLKPKVYFDPDKDAAPNGPKPEPKIKRSFLSNEPLPKSDEGEKRTVEEAYKANDITWEPWTTSPAEKVASPQTSSSDEACEEPIEKPDTHTDSQS